MVSSINSSTGVTDASSGAAAMKKATGLNKDDFLKLYIAQMQNQDPLNPMDGTQFVAQLAQLSQVEQAYNTNSNLKSLIDAQNSSNNLAAVSFLGNIVTAKGAQVSLNSGSQPMISFALAGQADKVQVGISNADGTLVRTLSAGQTPAGNSSLKWDGLSNQGQPLPPGLYSIAVTATDARGQQSSGTPLLQGKVDGISLDGNVPLLSIGGVSIPLKDVISVKGA